MLEIINLITCGLSVYNFQEHIASDIPVDGEYLDIQNCESQNILNSVVSWTDENKMKLNESKTKYMVFNPSRTHQFGIRLHINDKPLEKVEETTLLGTVISSDLSWSSNTDFIVRKAYKRLEIVRKLYSFNVPTMDLVHIYILYVRSVLEFNCCVWHYSLTVEQRYEIERVQKVACKIILKKDYISYEKSLEDLNLQTLEDRRNTLCKRFAQKCVKGPSQISNMFPLDETRHSNRYKVTFARNSRLLHSAIPQMQRVLNKC